MTKIRTSCLPAGRLPYHRSVDFRRRNVLLICLAGTRQQVPFRQKDYEGDKTEWHSGMRKQRMR